KHDAELHAEEDRKRRELIEARNAADTLVYTSEKALTDAGEKVPPPDKSAIEEKIAALKKIKDGEDTAAIRRGAEELSQAISKIGQLLYQQAAGSAQTSPGASAAKEDGEPIEGKYEEIQKEDDSSAGEPPKP
ncbi:Hsp70 family protein, partial [Candidatus Parcubacteria bacterium]|nr:Hsp70 family protein [Candidatus Parcubacteria bacterium]